MVDQDNTSMSLAEAESWPFPRYSCEDIEVEYRYCCKTLGFPFCGRYVEKTETNPDG